MTNHPKKRVGVQKATKGTSAFVSTGFGERTSKNNKKRPKRGEKASVAPFPERSVDAGDEKITETADFGSASCS